MLVLGQRYQVHEAFSEDIKIPHERTYKTVSLEKSYSRGVCCEEVSSLVESADGRFSH
ncbi:hypothetical protein SAMN05428977_104624 [Nitrosomonas sp. Nm166]|nr:hypothetical protein SAMN05428977_104624 [Nitrosomonas sp. Nm166]